MAIKVKYERPQIKVGDQYRTYERFAPNAGRTVKRTVVQVVARNSTNKYGRVYYTTEGEGDEVHWTRVEWFQDGIIKIIKEDVV